MKFIKNNKRKVSLFSALLLALIAAPFIINILIIQVKIESYPDANNWLVFWGTYLGSMISAGVGGATAYFIASEQIKKQQKSNRETAIEDKRHSVKLESGKEILKNLHNISRLNISIHAGIKGLKEYTGKIRGINISVEETKALMVIYNDQIKMVDSLYDQFTEFDFNTNLYKPPFIIYYPDFERFSSKINDFIRDLSLFLSRYKNLDFNEDFFNEFNEKFIVKFIQIDTDISLIDMKLQNYIFRAYFKEIEFDLSKKEEYLKGAYPKI